MSEGIWGRGEYREGQDKPGRAIRCVQSTKSELVTDGHTDGHMDGRRNGGTDTLQ